MTKVFSTRAPTPTPEGSRRHEEHALGLSGPRRPRDRCPCCGGIQSVVRREWGLPETEEQVSLQPTLGFEVPWSYRIFFLNVHNDKRRTVKRVTNETFVFVLSLR